MGDGMFISPDSLDYNHNNITLSAGGMLYDSPSHLVSHRATLIKSGWLYCIFGIQPVLTILVLGSTISLHSVPVGKGFGLITMLAGIQIQTLHLLQGASLSGELKEKVRVTIKPQEANADHPFLEYHISKFAAPRANAKLTEHIEYS